MALMLRCPRCKSENDASSAKPGSIIKCLHCRGDMRIPEAAKAAPPGGRPPAGGGRQSTLFRRMTNATVPGQRGRGAPLPGSGGGGRGASDRGRDLSGLYMGGGIAAIVAIIIVIGVVMKGKSSEPEKKAPRKEVAKAPMAAPPPPPPPPPPVIQQPPTDRTPPSSWEPDASGTLLTPVRPVPTEAEAEKDALHFIETSNTKRLFGQPYRYMPFVINALVSEDQKLALAAFKVLAQFCEERSIKFADGTSPVDLRHVNSARYRGYVYSHWAGEWWPRDAQKLPDSPANVGHVDKVDWVIVVNEMKSGSYHDETTPAGAAFRKAKNLGSAAWPKIAELIDHEDLSIGRSAAMALMELTGEKKPLPNEQNRTEVKNAWIAWINKNK